MNTLDIIGGRVRAAYRLHKSLLAQCIDIQMLRQSKKVYYPKIGWLKKSQLKQEQSIEEIRNKKLSENSRKFRIFISRNLKGT